MIGAQMFIGCHKKVIGNFCILDIYKVNRIRQNHYIICSLLHLRRMPFIICRPGNGRNEWGEGGSATLLPPQIMCSEAITGLGWPLDPPLQNLPPPSPTWCFQINGLSTPWVSAPRLIIPNPVYRANNCRISHKKNILGASRRISRPT